MINQALHKSEKLIRVGQTKTDEKQYLYELKLDSKKPKLTLGRKIPVKFSTDIRLFKMSEDGQYIFT
jgi:hypothetical protein